MPTAEDRPLMRDRAGLTMVIGAFDVLDLVESPG